MNLNDIELKILAKAGYSEAQMVRVAKNKLKAQAHQKKIAQIAVFFPKFPGYLPDPADRKNAAKRFRAERKQILAKLEDISSMKRDFAVMARAVHLARMFLRGTPLLEVEYYNRIDRAGPDWGIVYTLISRFADGNKHNEFHDWLAAAGRDRRPGRDPALVQPIEEPLDATGGFAAPISNDDTITGFGMAQLIQEGVPYKQFPGEDGPDPGAAAASVSDQVVEKVEKIMAPIYAINDDPTRASAGSPEIDR